MNHPPANLPTSVARLFDTSPWGYEILANRLEAKKAFRLPVKVARRSALANLLVAIPLVLITYYVVSSWNTDTSWVFVKFMISLALTLLSIVVSLVAIASVNNFFNVLSARRSVFEAVKEASLSKHRLVFINSASMINIDNDEAAELSEIIDALAKNVEEDGILALSVERNAVGDLGVSVEPRFGGMNLIEDDEDEDVDQESAPDESENLAKIIGDRLGVYDTHRAPETLEELMESLDEEASNSTDLSDLYVLSGSIMGSKICFGTFNSIEDATSSKAQMEVFNQMNNLFGGKVLKQIQQEENAIGLMPMKLSEAPEDVAIIHVGADAEWLNNVTPISGITLMNSKDSASDATSDSDSGENADKRDSQEDEKGE